jgi:hypothetical protein
MTIATVTNILAFLVVLGCVLLLVLFVPALMISYRRSARARRLAELEELRSLRAALSTLQRQHKFSATIAASFAERNTLFLRNSALTWHRTRYEEPSVDKDIPKVIAQLQLTA